MTNEELMQLLTDMGLHEGGMENWVMDNAWLEVANRVAEEVRGRTIESEKAGWLYAINKAIEEEREECAKVCESYQDAVDRHKWPNGYECAATIRARAEK